MADSENSRTLSPVTRRGSRLGTAVWPTEQIAKVRPDCGATASAETDERVLCLWRDRIATHRKVEQLCRAQQRLERRLVTAIGFPRVEILAADIERPVAAFTAGEIHTRLGGEAGTAEARKEAKAVLRARQHAWDAIDERLGYSRARRVEAEAEAKLDKLAEALLGRARPIRRGNLPRSFMPFCSDMRTTVHATGCRGRQSGVSDQASLGRVKSI